MLRDRSGRLSCRFQSLSQEQSVRIHKTARAYCSPEHTPSRCSIRYWEPMENLCGDANNDGTIAFCGQAAMNTIVSNRKVKLSADKLVVAGENRTPRARRRVRAANGYRILSRDCSCVFFEVTLGRSTVHSAVEGKDGGHLRIGYQTKRLPSGGENLNLTSWWLCGELGKQCRFIHLEEKTDCGPAEGFSYGVIIGVLLHVPTGTLCYYFDGVYSGQDFIIFHEETNVYAAALFTCSITLTFNFGKNGFRYPPKLPCLFLSTPNRLPSEFRELSGYSENAFVGMLLLNLDCLAVVVRELPLRDRVSLRCCSRYIGALFHGAERPTAIYLSNIRELLEDPDPSAYAAWFHRTLSVSFDVALDPFPTGRIAPDVQLRIRSENGKVSSRFYSDESSFDEGLNMAIVKEECNILSFRIDLHPAFPFRNSEVILSAIYYSDLGYRYESCNQSAMIHCVEPYCLHGDGLVLMEGGTLKFVKHLQVGDKVISSAIDSTNVTTISCVVRTPANIAEMVRVKSLLITPNHPIRLASSIPSPFGSEWVLPRDIAALESVECELFNCIVESRGSLIVNNIEVCTLGQYCAGIDKEDSYFGSERVVSYLKSQSSWPYVTLNVSQ